ncbi:hypothetical protein K4K55_011444 [Colletotrichum sp. SAR 10_96]|nr:hypothetical protein K4K55_011444 [Colletotrichum sp. SAR 10_96]
MAKSYFLQSFNLDSVHIPSPPLASISPLWLLRAACGGNMHLKLYEANQKYAKYSSKEVISLEDKIDGSVLRLMRLIDTYVAEDKRFDFRLKAQYFTLNVISNLAFSNPFSDLASNSDVHSKLIRMAKEIAGERFGPNKKSEQDMLSSFVAHSLTEEEASSEILMQILAGSNTTATAIQATLLHLITNPRVLATLHAEIARSQLS